MGPADVRDPESAAIGARLRDARLAAGLSQRQLAAGLPRVSYAYLSRIEAGYRRPSLRALRELARRLDVSPTFLETGRDFVELELDRGLVAELRRVVQTPTLEPRTPRELLRAIEAAAVAQGVLAPQAVIA